MAETLAQWMEAEEISVPKLAHDVGRDRTRVLRWRDGKGCPDIEALARLEELSGGRVTAKSFAGEAA